MKLYIVQFYNNKESGSGWAHTELYTSHKAALRRYDTLKKNLDCYSWVYLSDTVNDFGRVKAGKILAECKSCDGSNEHYRTEGHDF